MARTDYYGIQTPVLQATSQAIRTVNGTVGTIAPEDYPDLISAMKNGTDYDNVMAQLVEETTTPASIASFTDGANNLPVKELICTINPTETGTGAKSPSNPYVIGGHTGINVMQNDGQTPPVTERTHHADFGQTVYGGSLNVTTGVLTIDRKITVIDSDSEILIANQIYIKSDACDFYTRNDDISPSQGYAEQPDDLTSDKLVFQKTYIWSRVGYPNTFAINVFQIHCNIANDLLGITDYTQETITSVKTKIQSFLANNAITVVIPVQPTTIQLDPIEVRTLLGSNNLYHDCNGNIEVTYRANGGLYVAQH